MDVSRRISGSKQRHVGLLAAAGRLTGEAFLYISTYCKFSMVQRSQKYIDRVPIYKKNSQNRTDTYNKVTVARKMKKPVETEHL